jgi:hypothetical protein
VEDTPIQCPENDIGSDVSKVKLITMSLTRGDGVKSIAPHADDQFGYSIIEVSDDRADFGRNCLGEHGMFLPIQLSVRS